MQKTQSANNKTKNFLIKTSKVLSIFLKNKQKSMDRLWNSFEQNIVTTLNLDNIQPISFPFFNIDKQKIVEVYGAKNTDKCVNMLNKKLKDMELDDWASLDCDSIQGVVFENNRYENASLTMLKALKSQEKYDIKFGEYKIEFQIPNEVDVDERVVRRFSVRNFQNNLVEVVPHDNTDGGINAIEQSILKQTLSQVPSTQLF